MNTVPVWLTTEIATLTKVVSSIPEDIDERAGRVSQWLRNRLDKLIECLKQTSEEDFSEELSGLIVAAANLKKYLKTGDEDFLRDAEDTKRESEETA